MLLQRSDGLHGPFQMHPTGALDQDGISGLQQGGEGLQQLVLGGKAHAARLDHGIGKQTAHAQDQVYAQLLSFPGHPFMEGGGLFAQLQHVAQDADLSSGCPGKDPERGLHGGGIGVVYVVEQGEAGE